MRGGGSRSHMMCQGVRAAVEVVSEESAYHVRDVQQSSWSWLHYPYTIRVVSLGVRLLASNTSCLV